MLAHRTAKALCIIFAAMAITAFAAQTHADTSPVRGILTFEHIGNIDQQKFNEPSGITYHPIRGTIFVVGDEGDIAEIGTDGTPIQSRHVTRAEVGGVKPDFEGVTVHTVTGLVYIAIEGDDSILEIDPEDLSILRQIPIQREFEGEVMLRPGGQGIEGITFVPHASHPDGGTFYVANQAFPGTAERSLIVEVEIPAEGTSPACIVRVIEMDALGIYDISGLWYDSERDRLFVISDRHNAMMRMIREGTIERTWAIPGRDQEGIAFDPQGFMYIAQDSGGILKIRPEGL